MKVLLLLFGFVAIVVAQFPVRFDGSSIRRISPRRPRTNVTLTGGGIQLPSEGGGGSQAGDNGGSRQAGEDKGSRQAGEDGGSRQAGEDDGDRQAGRPPSGDDDRTGERKPWDGLSTGDVQERLKNRTREIQERFRTSNRTAHTGDMQEKLRNRTGDMQERFRTSNRTAHTGDMQEKLRNRTGDMQERFRTSNRTALTGDVQERLRNRTGDMQERFRNRTGDIQLRLRNGTVHYQQQSGGDGKPRGFLNGTLTADSHPPLNGSAGNRTREEWMKRRLEARKNETEGQVREVGGGRSAGDKDRRLGEGERPGRNHTRPRVEDGGEEEAEDGERGRPQRGGRIMDTVKNVVPEWMRKVEEQISERRDIGCSKDDVPNKVWDVLRGVVNGTLNRTDMLDIIEDVPAVCLQRLSSQFVSGSCKREEVTEALCKAEGNVIKARSLFRCLNKDDICGILMDIIKGDLSECIQDEDIVAYAEYFRGNQCPTGDVPDEEVLFLPAGSLREKLRNMTREELLRIMKKAASDDILDTQISCDKILMVSKAMEKLGLLSDLDRLMDDLEIEFEDFVPFLPFMGVNVCRNLTKTQLANVELDDLENVPLHCKKRRTHEKDAMEARSSPGADAAGSRKPSDAGKPDSPVKDSLKWMLREGRAPSCRLPCERLLMEKLIAGDDPIINVTADEDIESLGDIAKCLPDDKLIDAVKPGKCSSISSDLIPESSQKKEELIRTCRPKKQARNMTGEDIEEMGCVALHGLSKTDVEQVPQEALAKLRTLLSECDRGGDSDTDFVDAVVERSDDEIDGNAVEKLGKSAVKLSREKLRELDKDELKKPKVLKAVIQGLEEIVGKRESGSRAKVFDILEKVEDIRDIANSKVMKQLSKRSLQKKIEEKGGDVEAIKELLGLNDEDAQPETNFAQAKMLASKLLGDKKKKDITKEDIEGLKGNIATGLSSKTIEELAESKDKLGIVKTMCEKDGWDGKQVEAIRNLTEESLKDFNLNSPFSEFTVQTAEAFAPRCLAKFGADALLNMSESACVEVCRKKSQDTKLFCYSTRSELQETLQACLKCLGKDQGGDLSEEDVDSLGKSLQVASDDVMKRIPADVIKRKAKLFRMRCTLKNVRDHIRKKVQENIEENQDGVSDLAELAGVYKLSQLPGEVQDRLAGRLADGIPSVVEGLLPPENEEGEEEEDCCMGMNSAEENKEIEDEREEVIDQVAAVVSKTMSPENRRKRQVVQYTCRQIKDMGPAAKKLTVSDIEEMDSEEVYNCLSALGNVEGWSSEQGATLVEAIKKAVGVDTVCALSSRHLKDMKYIMYHMSVSDVRCLDNLDQDAVTSLGGGRMTGWAPEVSAEFAQKYLRIANVASAAAFTGTDLTALGHFICGLPDADIENIKPSELASAMATLGQTVETCPREKLMALSKVAMHEDAYGPVTSWDAGTFNELGIITAGLSGHDLKTASVEDVEGWTVDAIAHMAGAELVKLELHHFRALSREQILGITDAAKDELSEEQKAALGEGLTQTSSDNMDNGAASQRNTGPYFLCLTVILVLGSTDRF